MKNAKFKNAAVAGAGLLALFAGSEAWAQVSPTQITQTATRLDASQVGALAGGIATNAQVTATVAAVASQYFYATGILMQNCEDATGAAIPLVAWSTTNLPGNPTFIANAASSASTCQVVNVNFATPLKSLAAGTAVTLYSPSGISHVAFEGYIYGYYGQ